MACVGGYATENPEARDYFDLVKQEAADGVAELIPNCPQEQVPVELARSRVFWHAMGIGVDEQREPLRIEHFGIATVEAMAAGCVPIVVDGGGQREIVTHGETGYLCNSLDEFAERTIELAVDRGRAEKLAAAARHRAKDFARPVFEARLLALIRPHLAAYPDARR